MYLRPVHSDLDPEICQAFIRENPLGLLITHLPSTDPSIAPIQASHIPFVIDAPPVGSAKRDADGGGNAGPSKGVLKGHMARANPQVKAILAAAVSPASAGQADSSSSGTLRNLQSYLFGSGLISPSTSISNDESFSTASRTLSEDVLIMFTSPTNSYVTPTFYTETKPSTHKVVPTWNYAAVQIYGTLKVYDKGPEASAFLQRQVEDVTSMEETKLRERCPHATDVIGEESWRVDMAPVSYVELLKKGIVGVEIEIKRIEGKWKMSQEDDQGDWEGVISGFRGLGTEKGKNMADMVEERGKKKGLVMQKKEEEGIEKDGTDHELSKASKEENQ